MIITYTLAFTVVPYQVAFIYGQKRCSSSTFVKITRTVGECMMLVKHFNKLPTSITLWLFSSSSSDVICLMDIAINFLSSFQDHETGSIVLKGSKITQHYMRWYFWIDFFSTVPDIIIWIWVIFFSLLDPKLLCVESFFANLIISLILYNYYYAEMFVCNAQNVPDFIKNLLN